jgi:hypothetical protein
MSAQREFTRNQRALAHALDELAAWLGHRLQAGSAPRVTWHATPPALAHLARRLRLTRFEQELLLLAAAAEIDPRFGPLLAQSNREPGMPWLTLGLALECLPNPEWDALTPAGRLRGWQLIELAGSGSALAARVVVDEAILHRLAGCVYPEPRIEPWLRPAEAEGEGDAEAGAAGECIAAIGAEWQRAPSLALAPVVRVQRGDGGFVRALAATLGLHLYRLAAHPLPPAPPDCVRLARLWEREALLRGCLLWVESDCVADAEQGALADFLDGLQCLVVLTGAHRLPLRRAQRQVELPGVSLERRLAAWHAALGTHAVTLNGQLAPIAEQFLLSPASIRRVADTVSGPGLEQALWRACRLEARQGLDQLAARVESGACWDDLVLPDGSISALRALVAQVRQRARVYREWGFGARGGRGLGISALFAGGSGTGKTLAAEVLANELQLDLYRVDLAALVSKYIGETEKHLARVFEAAEASGAILLFDEADALFGKRSEVRDSHDRYANLEVSYLLQRLETYRGLAILTTNLKQAIDGAFLRRLRFVVHFPFPDAAARSAIWQRVFPPATPTDALDIGKLARLSLSGGHIRNLALNAAFLAADAGDVVSMRHLRHAAQAEFAKLEQQLPGNEVGDWA